MNRDGDDWVAGSMGLDPFGNLGQVLVLLAYVILLAEIDEIDNRLGRKKEQRVNDFDLVGCKHVLGLLC